jgi:hypothetical protein
MKTLIIEKEISAKWLTLELLAAGLNVAGVGINRDENEVFVSAYVEVDEVDEAAALVIIEAHDPESTPDVAERADFNNLGADITNQIDWINVTIPEIDNGLAAVGAFTNPTQRAIIAGLLQNQRRILLILRGVLRAFRFVIRQLR